MTVVPHRSDEPEQQATVPAERGVKAVPTSAMTRSKDATAGAFAARRGASGKAFAPKQDATHTKLADRIAQLADKTASQTRSATETAVAASKLGLARAAEIGRGTVLPEIERTGAKLKERARPERLKQDYRDYLHWLHGHVLDPSTESLFFIPTKDPVALDGLTICGAHRAEGHGYRPTPCSLFKWALAGIDYDLSRLTFVDYGAGKGRVLLLASEHPFAAVGGIEFAEELHDNALMNIQQYPRSRMKCRNVECMLEDASEVGPPDGEALHYFFNPFSRDMFAEVLSGIVVSYRKRPRRLYLVLIDPVATDLVDESGVFTRLELPVAERIKMKLFSPYEIALYRSLA
jgi:hypothetical protein